MTTTKKVCLLATFIITAAKINAQTTLNAIGSDTTYELINAALAPGYEAVETPDCVHKNGRHIQEVFDSTLNKYVFSFLAHKSYDNDRCINFDRQRTEIKTYDKSPANLKGIKGEKVEYTWKFKISSDFQPSSSFTHLHQLKAVDGPHDAMPLITLTARKASQDRLELRYGEELTQITLKEIPLQDFRGEWVSVTEVIKYEEKGKAEYSIIMTRDSDNKVLLDYANNTLKTWKTDASFLRPKWGIYRSLDDSNSLKDESVLFSDFSIKELIALGSTAKIVDSGMLLFPNPVKNTINLEPDMAVRYATATLCNSVGEIVLSQSVFNPRIDVSSLSSGIYYLQLTNDQGQIITEKLIKE